MRWLCLLAGLVGMLASAFAGAQSFVEFPLPAGAQAYGITAGPDGNLWFAEGVGYKIGRITTAGVITEFSLPGPVSAPHDITAGPDGSLWFTALGNPNYIGRITSGGVTTGFPIPTANSEPQGISAGPDGNLWFVENSGNKIGRITTAGVITEFPLPTLHADPNGIAAGPDGNLWFTEPHYPNGKIGRITTAGVITEFPVPSADSAPIGITAGPDGSLWFTEWFGNRIGRISTAGVITEFPIPGIPNFDRGPFGITAGPDGNIWFTEASFSTPGPRVGKIGRITTTGVITEFPALYGDVITAGPDGNLWFTTNRRSIGRTSTMPDGLCLDQGRFCVQVAWQAASQATGGSSGFALPITSNTGAFWFFDPTNLELVVKVLDGRSINGKWWVFYGSLTNVQFTLAVTDTQTGAVKTYTNPQGQLASVADTSAF